MAGVARGWTLRASAGTQYQPPPLAAIGGLLGNPGLGASRAFEIDAGVEHAMGGVATISVDIYRRGDRGALFALSGTLGLGAEWRYGSGMPRPGFFRVQGATLVVSSDRNQVRLAPYDRLDLRIRKVFLPRWGVFTLSGEVINVLNRKNEYNVESTILSLAQTGQFISGLRRGFPVVPSISLSVQF